jgi:hypothetical protein
MSIIDQFTSTHSDDQQQNSARVLNPETRRALDRELGATRRLWAVILAFVPFVYASAFLWTLGLSVQLLAVFLAADMLAGIGVSMYVALRVNLILRPRGESQALPDADEATAEAIESGLEQSEHPNESDESEPDGPVNPDQQETEPKTDPEQAGQPEPQESDGQEHESSDPNPESDGEPADEQAQTQRTDDTTDTTSERVIS